MNWSVLDGDFDEQPAPAQYFRYEDWEYFEEGPPFPILLSVTEKWKAKKTFTSPGHYHFEVKCAYSNGPPYGPVIYTYDVYVVDGHVDSVAFWWSEDPVTHDLVKSVGITTLEIQQPPPDPPSVLEWNDPAIAFGDDGNHDLPSPEWVRQPARAVPVCFVKEESPILEFTITLSPWFQGAPQMHMEVEAWSADPQNANDVMVWTTAVDVSQQVTARIYTNDILPNRVAHDLRTFHWFVASFPAPPADWHTLETTTVPFWQTWAPPFGGSVSEFTAKRLDFATNAGDGAMTLITVADMVWGQLADPHDPPDGPQEPFEGCDLVDTWGLLDGGNNAGECDEQARFMVRVLNILGIYGDDTVKWRNVYGSWDEDCLDTDEREGNYLYEHPPKPSCTKSEHNDEVERILLRMLNSWHAFEGCCWVKDGEVEMWYSLWPPGGASTALEILRGLPLVRQSWCVMHLNLGKWYFYEECAQQDLP